MSAIPEALKNWDWDKLQEKRAKQPGYTPPPRNGSDDGNDSAGRPESGRRRGFGGGGGFTPPSIKIPEFKLPGGRGLLVAVAVIFLLWLASGIYIVNPDEEGVVLTFGKYSRSTGPGPH